ncbi:MAG: 3-deoxy-7-phosphoheptulonate synthase, partial [Betaproteobacteria bacterium]|nr:3-deoxy-7-phosphoheptulonate synthase [Betaproteobacteria bacterium]
SHANAAKQFKRQLEVAREVSAQVACGSRCIIGAMVESHLVEGRQDLVSGKPPSSLTFGQSITDPCLGWDDSVETLAILAKAVKARRRAAPAKGRR